MDLDLMSVSPVLLAGAVIRMSASPVLLLLCLLLRPCRAMDVFHLDPDPNTPKDMAVSPSITIAEDPRGKLPPQFSLCASFYQGLRTRATGYSNVRIFSECFMTRAKHQPSC